MPPDRRMGTMPAGLPKASHVAILEGLPALVVEHAARRGFIDPALYLADLRQELLVRLRRTTLEPLITGE